MFLQVCLVDKLYTLHTEILKQCRTTIRLRKDEFSPDEYTEMVYLVRRGRDDILHLIDTMIRSCILSKILDIEHFEENVDHHVEDYFHVSLLYYIFYVEVD